MAVAEHADPAIVLRIVYDGPPEAGKTTSVRALARGFGREVYTPEERDGRTVFFDWLEHTGGRFDGAPIRCQIVSVPGQDCWLHRRLALLERADVVVFVGDTSAAGWPATIARLRDLRRRLDARPGPVIGVVFQANRRDAPDALSLAHIREHVGSERVALVESVAVDGTGVREAFVFAVRLALDSVREQQSLGTPARSQADASGQQLLEQLLALEPHRPASPGPDPTSASPLNEPSAPSNATVGDALPNHEVPSGLIWPPVEGRILLREAMSSAPRESHVAASGDYEATLATGHRAYSPVSALFDDVETGRAQLIAWARVHASAQPLLSSGRCIVLAETGEGRFRLWQIIPREPSLRELFIDGCEAMIPRHAARQLATAHRLLADAQAQCARRAWPLACTLDSVGASDEGAALYVAHVPLDAPSHVTPSATQMLGELSSLLERRSLEERRQLCRELDARQRHEPSSSPNAPKVELLSRLLRGGALGDH